MGQKVRISPAKIEDAIQNAEALTSAEIIPIVLAQSDFYPAAHFRLAILCALSLNPIIHYIPWEWEEPTWYLWVQVPALIFGYFLGFRPSFKKLFSTSSEIKEEVHQKALELFHRHKVHTTKNRNGVLILVSLLERRVEIIPDHGIIQNIESNKIQQIIKRMTRTIKREGVESGLIFGIQALGELFQEKFPIQSETDRPNELSNSLQIDPELIEEKLTVERESLSSEEVVSSSEKVGEPDEDPSPQEVD